MPTAMLTAYAEQLPRISAEESLLFAERVAVGTGSLKKGEGRRVASRWTKLADQRRPVFRPSTPEVYRAQMSSLGIGVKPTPKARPDA